MSERTLQPTPLRLAEARRQGQVARSRELAGAVVLLAGLLFVALAGRRLLGGLSAMTGDLLDGGDSRAGDLSSVWGLLWVSLGPLLKTCGLLLAGLVAVAWLAGFTQVGPMMATERIRPDLSRLSPARGLRRLMSVRSWVRAGLGLVRIGAVTAVVWATIAGRLGRIASTPRLPAAALAAEAGSLAWSVGMRVGAVLLLVAGVDFLYQRWQHRQDLRITRRELRDDLRQMEGSPEVRRRRRELLRHGHGLAAGAAQRAARGPQGDPRNGRGRRDG